MLITIHRVPTLLPDDPYVAVRQAHLVDTDTDSGPVEDLREKEVPQPLLVVPSPVPSLDDLHLTVGQAHTPATVDTESEPEEAPSKTEKFEASKPSDTRITSSHSSASSDSTAPLSLDHPLTQTSPTPTPTRVLFHHRTAHMARGTAEEGSGMEEEGEAILEGQQQAVPAADTTVGEPLGLGYEALRCRELAMGEDQVPTTFEVCQSSKFVLGQQGAKRVSASRQPTLTTWVDPTDGRVYTDIPAYVPPVAPVPPPPYPEWSSGSLPVSPSSPVVPSPIASLVATLASTISVDEDYFLEVGAQLELHGSILHDHSQRLDALPPTLFEGYDRYLRELYTRSGEAGISFRGMAGQTDAQMAALWHAIYDTQRDNHDLRRQITEERHERL
ncbi:hypothetical protein Tco_0881230 [Tanacetum coccineum]